MEYDCIDACVVLEALINNDRNCVKFVNTVGYKLSNTGLLTIPLVGEIFVNLLFKERNQSFIIDALHYFDDLVTTLINKKRLVVVKLKPRDINFIEEIMKIDYSITFDDAFHLSFAINNKCQKFITLDNVLLKENVRAGVKKLGLIIVKPS